MYEFNKINNNVNNENMLNMIINALKYTSEKYNYEIKDYSIQAISVILKENLYNRITREKGMRDSIMLYFPPGILFELILNTLEETKKFNVTDLYTLVNIKYPKSKYQISEENLDIIIEEFVNIILTKLNERITTYPNSNETIPSPRNIQMYSPSEELRTSIINNRQTMLKYSSYTFQGMQAYSNIGKHRNTQEDSYYIGCNPQNENFRILVVADGMGGSQQGEIASNIAVKELMLWFDTLPSNEYYNKDNRYIAQQLQAKVNDIQREICKKVTDGGTTLCVAIIKNNSIVMGNIGDSQGYIIKNNELIFATMPDSGPIIKLGIPKEIARFHKRNNEITSFLGKNAGIEANPKMNITETKLKSHRTYKVILCSDGVTDCISEKKIIEIASEQSTPSQALVEYAIENDSYLQDEFREFSNYSQAFAQMLNSEGLLFEKISGGKDNTTAASAIIRR